MIPFEKLMKTRIFLNCGAVAAAIVSVAALCGCSENKWHAKGVVNGAESADLIVEAPNGRGGWYPVDTVTTDKSGAFSVVGEAVGHPEIFRLTLNGESVYFPIDSIESVDITADAANFGSGYTLAGSESAEKLLQVNNLIDATVKAKGADAAAYDPDLKRKLAEVILRDPDGIVAYYTIFRRVGNTPVFDPAERGDLRIIGAVANAFDQNRPADPRTAFLRALFLSNRRPSGAGMPVDTIVAREIMLPEISLLDETGAKRSLNEVASKGKVVVLNFTAYSAEVSPALNIELAKIYDANKAAGLEIYQVGFDADEFAWKQSARNLPWVTVYNSPKDGEATLRDYNVGALPAIFVINRNGELVERVEDPTRLSSAVARYL